jgi:ABC-type lipoprotein release transport system permease subunit
VKRGDFRRTVRLTGGVRAVESYTVLAPRLSGQMMGTGNMVITGIVRNGVSVRKGDILVEFDRQNQEKNILDRQAEYEGLAARISDETDLKSAEVDIRIAQVEMRKRDVLRQFLVEAILISFVGGLLGIGCGFGLSRLVAVMAGWSTIITVHSILLAFVVSVSVGLIFGIYPAAKAARLDPVEALRHEG